jgi:hypothetical protein
MATRFVLPVVLLLFVIGCAGNPVPVDLPHNHPADPGAYESQFILPLDPFGAEMTSASPQGHDQSENAAGQRKSRGDLFESPAGKSAPPGQEEKAGDNSPSGMPHGHHMEQVQ